MAWTRKSNLPQRALSAAKQASSEASSSTSTSTRKSEPTEAANLLFSPGKANQPERLWDGLTEADGVPVARATERSCGGATGATERAGPARGFRAGPASDQGGERWGGTANAGVFPGGWVWGFRGRHPRPGFSEPGRRPAGAMSPCSRLSVPHRTNRVAPLGAAIAVDGQKEPNAKGAAKPAAEVGRASHPPPNTRQWGRPFKASPLPSQQVVRSLQGRPQVVFAG